MKIYVFNVGQGDHILIQLPNGSYGIIDSHYCILNYLNEPPGLTFLKQRKAAGHKVTLAFLHVSHYHYDHIKGLDQWLKWINCEKIPLKYLWLPGAHAPQIDKINIKEILHDRNLISEFNKENKEARNELKEMSFINRIIDLLDKYEEERINQKLRVDYLDGQRNVTKIGKNEKEVWINCLGPQRIRTRRFERLSKKVILKSIFHNITLASPDQNDISTILLIHYAGFNILLGSDASKDNINESIKEFYNREAEWRKIGLGCDFIKIFHHGAEYSSSTHIWKTFIKQDAEVKIAISSGVNRKYNHPRDSTISDIRTAEELNGSEVKIYCTRDHESLSQNLKTNIIQSEKEVNIKWPIPNKIKLKKINKLRANIRAASRGKKSTQKDIIKPTSFLGHKFKFHFDQQIIKVEKMIAKA